MNDKTMADKAYFARARALNIIRPLMVGGTASIYAGCAARRVG